MCRFVLYMGPEIKMASLVTEPAHSIVVQSYHSEEREEPLNGDGFGIAWYPTDGDAIPAVFKSITPAWNNLNLLNLSRVIHSDCMLAHVRAATPGLPVTQSNCHPFIWQQLTFMHNGAIGDFKTVKRQLRNSLSDSRYNWIQGTTDSETIFALFVDHYSALKGKDCAEKLATALLETIASIESLQKQSTKLIKTNDDDISSNDLNLVVTDGKSAVVSRYSTPGTMPNSLYVHTGHRYRCDNGEATLTPCEEPTVLVSSEPLTRDGNWQCVEPNHLVIVNESLEVEIQPIKEKSN